MPVLPPQVRQHDFDQRDQLRILRRLHVRRRHRVAPETEGRVHPQSQKPRQSFGPARQGEAALQGHSNRVLPARSAGDVGPLHGGRRDRRNRPATGPRARCRQVIGPRFSQRTMHLPSPANARASRRTHRPRKRSSRQDDHPGRSSCAKDQTRNMRRRKGRKTSPGNEELPNMQCAPMPSRSARFAARFSTLSAPAVASNLTS